MPSTREFAVLFIFLLIFLFGFKHISNSIPKLVIQFLQLLKLVYVQIILVYVVLITSILIYIGFLEWKLATGYLITTIGILSLVFPSGYATKKIDWMYQFKKIFALTAILTVVMNNYTMNFFLELILGFLVTALTLIVLMLKRKDPQNPVIKVSNFVLSIIGFAYLGHTIYSILNNLNDLLEPYFWKNLFLGMITFLYVPLVLFLRKHHEKLNYLKFPKRKKSI